MRENSLFEKAGTIRYFTQAKDVVLSYIFSNLTYALVLLNHQLQESVRK